MSRFISFFLVMSFALVSANSFAWQSVLSCDGGKLVVDEESYSYRGDSRVQTQLVIRDANAVDYLLRTGAFTSKNERGEIISSDSLIRRPAHLGNPVFIGIARRIPAGDSSGFAWVAYELHDLGNGTIKLIAQKGNPYPSERPLVADWVFHGCSYN